MAQASIYLYEFLYRGRAPGDATAPAYHVLLAQDSPDAFGGVTTALSPALTPDQAKAQGFDLPAIISAINAGIMAENAALKAQIDAAESAAADPVPTEESAAV